ncbi:MAG: methyltransferase domain-containing protein [Planctomycetota bacterium]|jgi:methylase of polypeptide subunit release factors
MGILRDNTIAQKRLMILIPAILCWMFILTGCKDSDEDRAVLEAAETRVELAKIISILEQTKAEKEELESEIAELSRELEKTKSEVATIVQLYGESRTEVSELTEERDRAIAEANDTQETVKKLRYQLKKKGEEVLGFKEWMEELQATIKNLESQLKVRGEQPLKVTGEQPMALLPELILEQIEELREPDVVFIPTPQDVVDKMLELAKVQKGDLIYDLGCGDGRIVVTAAKKFGCRAIGYDIDPLRVEESLENVEQNNVGHLVRIEQKDIFTLDLSRANVVTLYLLPELNVELIPQLERLRPGSRIVSHDFDMEGIKPDEVVQIVSGEDGGEHEIYLWTSPLKKE